MRLRYPLSTVTQSPTLAFTMSDFQIVVARIRDRFEIPAPARKQPEDFIVKRPRWAIQIGVGEHPLLDPVEYISESQVEKTALFLEYRVSAKRV
jgi:hypothetical protein